MDCILILFVSYNNSDNYLIQVLLKFLLVAKHSKHPVEKARCLVNALETNWTSLLGDIQRSLVLNGLGEF